MKASDIARWVDGFAPFDTAESYDNVGLLVGTPDAQARGVLFCVDCTPAVAAEAVALGANVIVSHHPLLFHAAHTVRQDNAEGRTIAALLQGGLTLIAAHTNYDRAAGGVSDALAAALGLTGVQPIAEMTFLRMGDLPAPMSAQAFCADIAERLRTQVCAFGGTPDRALRRVAVGPGVLGEGAVVAARAGVDAYVTGEIRHHELIAACAEGIAVFAAGHFATEAPGIDAMFRRWLRDFGQETGAPEAHLSKLTPYAGALR